MYISDLRISPVKNTVSLEYLISTFLTSAFLLRSDIISRGSSRLREHWIIGYTHYTEMVCSVCVQSVHELLKGLLFWISCHTLSTHTHTYACYGGVYSNRQFYRISGHNWDRKKMDTELICFALFSATLELAMSMMRNPASQFPLH